MATGSSSSKECGEPSPIISEPLRFRDRGEWRHWLAAHNSDTNRIWIVIKKKNSLQLGIGYEDAVEDAVSYGWIDGKMRTLNADEFILMFTPRRRGSVWSLRNREIAERLMTENQMAEPGLAAVEEAKRSCRWDSAYSSRTAPNIPYDLEKALKKNENTWVKFQSLSNSMKLQYVYWVNESKQEETRMKRIAEVIAKIGVR